MVNRRQTMLALAALAAAPLGCTRRSHGANTVRFWAVGREGEYAVELLQDFLRERPDIEVEVQKLPWTDSNDSYPMWIGNTVYFISDRTFTGNLYSWTPGAADVKQLTRHQDFDIMNASAGPDAIVYEQAGQVHLFDVRTGASKPVPITVTGDFPWARA